jgi:hypothetical protein
MKNLPNKESLDKYIDYFDPRHHEQYRFSYLVTMKKLVFVHLRKQGYSKRDLLKVFRCNISSIRHLEKTANDFNDTEENTFQNDWMWFIGSGQIPVRKMNSLADDGNQCTNFEMKLISILCEVN